LIRAVRIGDGPIVGPGMGARLGTNFNGPCPVRMPDWLPGALGRYHLYFAHHNGDHIRLASADRVEGPWRVHDPGVLDLAETPFVHHVASPAVVLDEARREIRMYVHGPVSHDAATGEQVQATRLALSTDGLRFRMRAPELGPPYFQVFEQRGAWYALAWGGELLRSPDGVAPFESAGGAPAGMAPGIRHVGLWRRGPARMTVLYTRIGDAPERIMAADLDLTGDWRDWRATRAVELLRPERDWEGARLPVCPSLRGAIDEPANELRDPAVLEDEGRVWMFYAVAGEAGIALAELRTT
jgi:hypothetical protein